MVDILGADIDVPSLGIGSGVSTLLITIVLFLAAGGITVFLIFNYRLYNKRIIIFAY